MDGDDINIISLNFPLFYAASGSHGINCNSKMLHNQGLYISQTKGTLLPEDVVNNYSAGPPEPGDSCRNETMHPSPVTGLDP